MNSIYLVHLASKYFYLYMRSFFPSFLTISRKFFLLGLMSVVLVPMAQATSEVGTYDTTHLIPPIYARDLLSSTSDVQNHYLYLSTNETTAFDVTIQNADGFNSLPGGISQTVSISKTSPQLITLSAAPY